MSVTSSAETESNVSSRPGRYLRSGAVCLALVLVGGFLSWVMVGMEGAHTAIFRYGGVALVLATLALAVAALWLLARGGWLWWQWRVPESATRRGVSRFFGALGKNPDQPVHKGPLWAPFLMAVVMSYTAYFDHGVFLAKTHEGTPPSEGRLVVESCEPNWGGVGFSGFLRGYGCPG